MKNASASNSFLVTGATGFIGSALFRRLAGEQVPVSLLARSPSRALCVSESGKVSSLLTLDLATVSQEKLSRLFPEVAVVFHAAAGGVTDSSLDSTSLNAVNVSGTKKLLLAARDNGVRRFVHIGSCFEYGGGTLLNENQELKPISQYAKTKAEASLAVLEASSFFEHGSVVLRPFMVYGPGEASSRLVPYLIHNAIAGCEIDLTGGNQTRDFVFISDVIDALLKASYIKNLEGEAVNICSGYGVSVKTVADLVLKFTKSKSKLKLGALPYREYEAMSVVGSPEKALSAMGWSAETSLEDGIAKTIADFRGESIADE